MTRHWNLALGLINAIWSAAVALLAIPFYLRYLGMEAYGLVGFLAALQAIFSLFDLGLTPTMSRDVARCRAAGDLTAARALLHTLAVIYWAVAVVIGIVVVLAAPLLATHWFKADKLSPDAIRDSVMLMGLVIAMRWPAGVYGGVLIGDDKLGQFSLAGIAWSTLASLGAVAVLAFISPTLHAFFLWQAAAAAALVVTLRLLAWRAIERPPRPRFATATLKRVWRFSAGIWIASILGIIFMQADKVVLSRLVSLEALGSYTVAGAVARTLYIVLSPTFNIVFPKLTALWTNGSQDQLQHYYSVGTRLLVAAVFPGAAFVSVFSYPLIVQWTRDPTVAGAAAPLIPWLIAGTALNGLMHFPYALQLAAGQSKLPALINLTLVIVFIPLLVWLTFRSGVIGAAMAWAALNTGYVVVGTYWTHRVIPIGSGWRWLLVDVLPVVVITFIVVVVGGMIVRSSSLADLLQLCLGALLAAMAAIMACLTHPPLAAILHGYWKQALRAVKISGKRSSDVA